MFRVTLALILVFSSFSSLFAQTDSSSFDSENVEIEVIPFEELLKMGIDVASFQEKNILNTPSTVSIIDKETIKRYNFTSVNEALGTVAGFTVMRTYLKRNIPTSRGILQDHYANKVLVMINNIPAWHAATGEGNLDRVNINDVERIEVLKGPASVLYGTNAYSGAVNIVLKKYANTSSSGIFRASQNGMLQGGTNFSFIVPGYSVFVSANSSAINGNDYTFLDQSNVSGKVSQYIKANDFTFNFNFKAQSLLFNSYNIDESYLGISPTFSAGAGKNHNLKGYLLNYGYKDILTDKLQFEAKATFDWEQRILSRSFDDDIRADVTGQRANGMLNVVYKALDNLSLQLGGEYGLKKSIRYNNISVQKDLVLEENYMSNKSVYDVAIFSQAEYDIASFNLLFGARYNKNELFGGNVSTRGTLVYELNNKNSVKFVYGTSYRAPSLFEHYFRTSTNTVFGNTSLKPEESTSYELSYLSSFDNFFVQVLGYMAQYTGKIFRAKSSVMLENGTIKQNVNVYTNGSKFNSKGVEIELKYSLPNSFDAFMNYSYVKGDNGDEIASNGHYNFKYIPAHTGTIGLAKKLGNFNIAGYLNYLSEQEAPKSEIGAQSILNMSVSYTHKAGLFNLTHYITAKNIFNRTILFPEYVNRDINAVPSGYGREIFYSLNFEI